MHRQFRAAIIVLLEALVAAALLTGCTYASLKDVLSPVPDANWSPGPTGFVVTYESGRLKIEVYSMTVSGTTFVGPGIPIVPAASNGPGRGLLMRISSTRGDISADLSRLRFFTTCGNGACPVPFSLQRYAEDSTALPSGPFIVDPSHPVVFFLLPQTPIAKDQTYTVRFADAVRAPDRPVPDVQLRVKSTSEIGGL